MLHRRLAGTFAGSGSTPAKTEPQTASRYPHAVSDGATSWAAPSIGYMCIVYFIVGISAPNRAWISTAASGISLTKSARQYHWSPGGDSPAKVPFSGGKGIRAGPGKK